MTDLKNNLEEVWNQEYRDFMLSFYPESSPLVSTWEIYRMAKIKSQKEIKNLLELTETLNQIRDNLQDENRKLEQELQKTREQLSKAEQRIFHAPHCVTNYERNDRDCGYEQYFKDKENKDGK